MRLQGLPIVFFCYLLSSTAGQVGHDNMLTQAPTLSPTLAATPPFSVSFESFCEKPYEYTNENDVPCGESRVTRSLQWGKAAAVILNTAVVPHSSLEICLKTAACQCVVGDGN